MSTLQIIGSVMLFISSIILILIVLAQKGRDAYLGGAIAGGAAESFVGKKQARTVDVILSKYTKIVAIVFVILTLIVDVFAFLV
jgi:preprotein translocase subunit SecG